MTVQLSCELNGRARRVVLACALLCFLATSSKQTWAQAEFLDFCPGARAHAMGRSLVTDPADGTALFWNPAGLAGLTETRLTLSTPGAFSVDFAGITLFLPPRTGAAFAVGSTGKGPEAYQVGSLAWARRLGRTAAFGTAISLLSHGSESWPTAGLGLIWHPGMREGTDPGTGGRYTIAFSAHNVPLVLGDVDHQLRFGVAYHPGGFIPALHFAYHAQRGAESTHFGIEWGPFRTMRVQAGLAYRQELTWGLGTALRWRNADLVIAYAAQEKRLLATISIGIGDDAQTLAARHREKATHALETNDLRRAVEELDNALAYGLNDHTARALADSLRLLVRHQDRAVDSLLQVGQRLEEKGWFLNATVNYLRVLNLDPDNHEALRRVQQIKPRVNVYLDQLYANGVEAFEKNDMGRAREIFQTILLVQNDHQGARSYLERMETLDRERARDYYLRALTLISDGKPAEARRELEQALARDPEHPGAQRLLQEVLAELDRRQRQVAILLADAGRAEERNEYLHAYTKYRQALTLQPENQIAATGAKRLAQKVEAHINTRLAAGTAAYRRGDYGEARRLLSQVLQLAPENQEAARYLQLSQQAIDRLAEDAYARGLSYIDAQNLPAALMEFQKALAHKPEHAGALTMRKKVGELLGAQRLVEQASAALANQNFAEALRLFQQALENDPKNEAAKRGAKECQERMANLAEEYFNRGMALYAEEDYRSAIEFWNRVLEINPNHSGAREYKKRAEGQLRALETIPFPR